MTSSTTDSRLSAGGAALAAGDWQQALSLLEPVAEQAPTGATLEALGTAYFWLDHPDTIDVRERAYRAYRQEQDPYGAARVATDLSFDCVTFRGEIAVAQGWLELAARALEGVPVSFEHGYLAAFEADMCITLGDVTQGMVKALEARAIGAELGAADIELIARAQEGKLLVGRGEVERGLRLLDASATAAVAGEFQNRALAGYACCYAISASSQLLDLPRATQWCHRLDDHCRKVGYHSLRHLCQIEYASVLVESGDWPGAEAEMRTAVDNLTARRPAMATEATVHLAELRRRQGRAGEAAELFAEVEGHPLAVLGQAELALDSGDAGTAERLATRLLRQLDADDRLSRAGAFALLLRARLHEGNVAGARDALDRMRESVEGVGPGPLRAGVLLAEVDVLLAEGAPDDARQRADDAVDAYDRAGSPYGAARARSALARVLLAQGDAEGADYEAAAAATGFDHLGAVEDAARARSLVHGRAAPGPLTAREVEVLRLVAGGAGTAEIAEALTLSGHTVHRHVANAMNRLGVRTRAAAVARAHALGQL